MLFQFLIHSGVCPHPFFPLFDHAFHAVLSGTHCLQFLLDHSYTPLFLTQPSLQATLTQLQLVQACVSTGLAAALDMKTEQG